MFSSLNPLPQMSAVPKLKWIKIFRNSSTCTLEHLQRSMWHCIATFIPSLCVALHSRFFLSCCFHISREMEALLLPLFIAPCGGDCQSLYHSTFVTSSPFGPLNLHRAQSPQDRKLMCIRFLCVDISSLWELCLLPAWYLLLTWYNAAKQRSYPSPTPALR